MFYFLFFLSGLSALIYEVGWQKILALNLGSTAESLAVILAGFMGGLSLGSYFWGKYVDRKVFKKPLLLFSFLEFGIGFLGIISIFILFNSHSWHIGAFYVFLASFLMGGTFPVIVKSYLLISSSNSNLHKSIGLFYSLNTWGGVIGAIATGYFLIRYFGIKGSIWFASGINLAVAIIAFIKSRKVKEASNNQKRCKESEVPKRHLTIIFAVFLAGFSSFTYEVCWTRTLSMIIGSTTYAFTLMLCAFLTGIAIGSYFFSIIPPAFYLTPSTLFGFSQLGIGITSLFLLQIFGLLPFLFISFYRNFSSNFTIFQISQFFLTLIPMLIPTTLMGFAFPLAIKIYHKNNSGVGSSIGNIYASNTLGCILGAISTSLFLIPEIGLQNSIILATFLNIGVGLLYALPKKLLSFSIASIYFILALSFFPQWDKKIITMGIFRDVNMIPEQARKREIKKKLKKEVKILYYKEGKIFTVAVKDIAGVLSLTIDGKPDASTGPDMDTQVLTAHLPLILKPEAGDCLVVGLASGITLGEVQKYSLKEIICCEIEPVMLEACKFFNKWNNNCLEDKRTKIVIDDIRGYLRKSKKKFDVIISEPSNIWMRGCATLFTKEHFELLKKHLKEEGILLQWLHTYRISPFSYKLVIRNLINVFPYVYLFGEGNFSICSLKKINLNSPNIEKLFEKQKKSLSPFGIKNYEDFLALFLMGKKELKRFAGKGSFHTDNFPILEFSGAKELYLAVSSFVDKEVERYAVSINRYLERPIESLSLSALYLNRGKIYQAWDELNLYLKNSKPNSEFYNLVGMLYLKTNELNKAEEFLKKGLKLNPKDIDILTNLAEVFQRKRKWKEAEMTLKKIIKLKHSDAVAYNNLGNLYLGQGRLKEAIKILELGRKKAKKMPLLELSLATTYFKNKNFEKAEKICKNLIKSDKNYAEAYFLLGEIYLTKNNPAEAKKNFNLALQLKPELIELLKERRK